MGPRTRKLVGSVGVLAFLTAYIWAASTVSDVIPKHPAAQLTFFAVAGMAWGIPLLPLFRWMMARD